MAKPIELELELTGEAARKFHEYINSSSVCVTPEGRRVSQEAIKLSKKLRLVE
jgi:hypothetical protein